MFDPSDDLQQRAAKYATTRRMQLEHQLGFGKDGIVLSTSAATAVKLFGQREIFEREWACYLRLMEAGTHEVLGHQVPQLRGVDEDVLVIEMTIVRPPFVLDFASAYLDVPPDFPPEVIDEWQQTKQEEFGANWGQVVMLLEMLQEQFGIYLLDVHPGNITFGEDVG